MEVCTGVGGEVEAGEVGLDKIFILLRVGVCTVSLSPFLYFCSAG